MKWLSLEELADRWTGAHTIAVTAWVMVLVLGVLLLVRGGSGNYPVAEEYKFYAAENATLKYPANWTINDCDSEAPFIELPGTISSNYRGKKSKLSIYGTGAYNCVSGRPERLDLHPEEMIASEQPCAPGTSTEGERLKNGLYLQLLEYDTDEIAAIHIKQNSCYAPENTLVLGFGFEDPELEPGSFSDHGPPRVNKDILLESPQYQDIRALAESISY